MELQVFGLRERVAAGAGLIVLLAAHAGWVATAQAAPVAQRTVVCSVARIGHTLGPTYVEALSVSGTSCSAGKGAIRAYNRCRLEAGGVRGDCRARVDGLGCRERRQVSPDEFIGLVSCTTSREAVDFTYTEFT